uniref:Uncharacterized protein n=1 Tax=Anguilla anguilla TaxID=7936 RepID=A0A0E9TD15_ANGAN
MHRHKYTKDQTATIMTQIILEVIRELHMVANLLSPLQHAVSYCFIKT